MEKGKLGVRLSFYGVCAFILAFLGYSTLLFLLAGVVLLAEKNEWALRQVIQAICLCLLAGFVNEIISIFDFIYDVSFIHGIWSTLVSAVHSIVSLIVLIFCIIGIINNAKGQEANVPFANQFADWAVGVINQKMNTNPNQQNSTEQ